MTILDHKGTADYISNWIRDYANKAGIKSLIIGLSGGIDSALVALLCRRTALPTICVAMPCHSSASSVDRAQALAKEYNLNLVCVDLSSAHDQIMQQINSATLPSERKNQQIAVGGLRSCLRAPTLSYFANSYNGIIVGTGNRSEDRITRYFQKFGDGCVDICPISDLYKREVYSLFAWLAAADHEFNDMFLPKAARDIYNAKPTADLWGPDSNQEDEKELGITYDEIEWADREDVRTEYVLEGIAGHNQYVPGIICNDDDPSKRPDFFRYTARQQQVIAKLHQMEKISRHKMNTNLPVCNVRTTNLVR